MNRAEEPRLRIRIILDSEGAQMMPPVRVFEGYASLTEGKEMLEQVREAGVIVVNNYLRRTSRSPQETPADVESEAEA